MSPTALTWPNVLSWRMERQLLDRPGGLDTVDVVRRLGGVQAQVASSAAQAVAVRTASGRAEVPERLADRSLVKTWAQRGTLHLLPADEAGAYLSLLAAARFWEKPSWQRSFATTEQIAKLGEAVDHALRDAVLTREELAAAIIEHSGEVELGKHLASGWGALLKPFAWQGLLCNALSDGNRVTFTSPATWLPGWKGLPEPDVAAAHVVPAYLGAYGPAGMASFDQWLLRGVTKKPVLRRWFGDLVEAGTLTEVDVEGERLHARTADLDELASTRPAGRVRLLPAFDQYVLGPGTSDKQIIEPARRPLISKAAGWISPVVVVDGRVAGTWTADGETLAIELFGEERAPNRDALDAEVEVLGKALGRPLAPTLRTI
ncbi:winged helix DNA-binding domain-containing protein [Pseudonocardia sp. TRM90224]|uniref:winged helix DNA-binding domain-containing protein n=1 Tax=Pseudonocardia sp. TRM90224 TaxID=2812678 RepID=UPI001E5F6AAE|nr:winged helix DNA-binding domain-containing protein [Pseudonocardia sp. TRM90224]